MSRAAAHRPAEPSDFTRDPRLLGLAAMAIPIGAIATGAAWGLSRLIALFTHLAFEGRLSTDDVAVDAGSLGLLLLVIPTVGGLLIGLLARFGSEKIRGHGIPEAIEAILVGRSRIQARVAALKPLASAISIGTGGPFGAEGPIIMTGGALGSLFAQRFRLAPAERKTLLVAGAAAGMAAIFASPLAAVLLAVELLLFEWRPRSLVPVALAACTAAALRTLVLGDGPVFPVPTHEPMGPALVASALVPGVVAGLAASLLTVLVYAFEDAFHRLPIHWMWWPAIGGLAVGVCGLVEPRALGIGFASIHGLLTGNLVGGALGTLVTVKALAWCVALGSGTSGGVLAPLLMLGAALGTLVGHALPGDTGLWALVGMAAVMGGTMRSPLTATAFAVELTHDLAALPAVLAACTAAHAVTVLLMRRSILTEKISRRGLHVAREYAVDPLSAVRVRDVMDRDAPCIPATTTVGALAEELARGASPLATRQAVLLVSADGTLEGILTRGDLVRAVECGADDFSVVDAGSTDLLVAHPDEILRDVVHRMVAADVGRMPVVRHDRPRHAIGYLGRFAILAAWARALEEETVPAGAEPTRSQPAVPRP